MDRDKALDAALAQIEKQFGKGSVMKMGDDVAQRVAAIPTGALALDVALGIGGLPRGRVVEIYGPESSGKCLVAGTYVWSDHGLETIEELFARVGQPTSCASRVTDVRDQGVRLVNEESRLETMAAVTHNNRKPVTRVVLESGRHVEATANHPLRVLNERGRIVWRTVGELKEGDVMVSALFGAETAVGGSHLSEDEAVLLGAVVAESIGDGAVEVPRAVRTGGPKIQAVFLSSLYEAVGASDEVTVALTTGSRALADQVQLLLYGLGVQANLVAAGREDAERYEVVVAHDSMHRFLEQVGFRSEQRNVAAADRLREMGIESRELDARPLTFERIVALEDGGDVPTFDVMVPETHSFIANGVLSHNTTVALHAIAEAQKLGGIAAFIDAEHALDPTYARALGVDINEMLVSQPDTGEQALEIADMLIRSSAVDIIVIDSVAALTPRAEIEGEMGDSHVGLQARLMSQALRKIAGSLNRSKTTAVFINQLREKIGIMFGCFSYNTRVTLADGTQEKIGKIVNQKLPVEVLSYDFESGEFVPRKVVNWFDNGPTDEFLRFTVARGGGNGRSQFSVTRNHLISTPYGWAHAGELEVGDTVLQSVPHHLSPFQWEVVLGGLMGDGALSPTRSGHGARFRIGHGAAQAEYADWKASLFANINVSRSTDDRGAVFHDLQPLPELAELRDAVYIAGKKVLSHDYLKRLTPLSLAIWYQDDGTFQLRSRGLQERTRGGSGRSEICVQAMEETSRQRLRDHLADTWNIDGKLISRAGQAVLQFPTAETAKLHELIAPYVHPSMAYKLLPSLRDRFDVIPRFQPMRYEAVPMPVVSISAGPPNGRHTHRFDIEVEGSHTYLADGVIVHNSPETTPGGRALKFYSSVRLDVRRIETLKDGGDAVGNRVRVKVVKNKCVAEGTKVFDPATGLTHDIASIVDEGLGSQVWAADKHGRLHRRAIRTRMDQGEQDVLGLQLRDSTTLWVTPDHLVMTEDGWRQAGELNAGDRVARPRRAGGFGTGEPIPAHHARILGYLIGDGYVGGKTPIAFINTQESLHEDAARIAGELGCRTRRRDNRIEAVFSHRKGERNQLLDLARWAGIWGHLAPDKRIPAELLAEDVAEDVLANLVFGIWESDGWISREQTGGVRVGFATTSEQLAWQLHWTLLRWGIHSSVRVQQPGDRRSVISGRRIETKLPCWSVRVSGIDNVHRFAAAVPSWGPRGQILAEILDDPALAKHRGARTVYLAGCQTEPVLAYLEQRGVTAQQAAAIIGDDAGDPQGGMKQVLGVSRLRRDRLAKLADGLDSAFLREVLADELFYDRIVEVLPTRKARTFDIEVDEFHNFVADGIVVHNCAPPFKQAEFDILYGEGISKEGSLLDMGVDHGIIRKAGAWYTYDEEQLGQGRENSRTFLKEHPDVAREIEKKVKDKLGVNVLAADAEALEEADDADER